MVWIDINITSGDSGNIFFKASTDKRLKFGPNIMLTEGMNVQSSLSPKIAANNEGNVYVVWLQNNVHFKEIVADGSIFGESIILSNETNLTSLQIDATKTGKIYVVWVESNKTPSEDNLLYFKRISEFFERNS